jgi:CDP-diacylglycerol--glycerol-3-phosphate 3-phosphatidyltransferase
MWWALNNNYNYIGISLGLLGVVTDVLDGYFARKFNHITEFGKIIDPVADKVIVGTTALVLLVNGRVPLWFLLALLGRDALIILAGIYATKKLGLVIPSNYIGKITVVFLSVTLAFVMLDWRVIAQYGMYSSTILIVISLIYYAYGMIIKLKQVAKNS